MLTQPVQLHNVQDAEAFVRHCIAKARIVLTEDERDELVAEGLALLVELAAKYDPSRDAGADGGKTKGFFGYALFLLPKKLGDAWHRSHPHHLLRTQPDGTRRYEYLAPTKSLDEWLDGKDGAFGNDVMPLQQLIDGRTRTPGQFVAPARPAA